jgi:hypothetical protein
MVQRSVSATDVKVPRGSDCGSNIGLGLLSRVREAKPTSKPGGDRRRQRATGPMQISCCDALSGKAYDITLPDQEVDTFVASTMSAFDQHVAHAES